jgi:hypothetical protein
MTKKRRKRREWQRRQIKSLTDEIMNCLKAQLWYAALVLMLTLPDICAALEAPDGQSKPDRYQAWCEKWLLANKYPLVSAKDLYFLRCGVAHQAKFRHPAMTYNRIFFTLRSKDGFWAHMNKHQGALNLDLVMFAKDMIDAVEAWYASEAKNQNVKKNIGSLIQYYPNGLLDFLNLPAIG